MKLITLRCEAPNKLPSTEVLRKYLGAGHYIVLEFEKEGESIHTGKLTPYLSEFFPDCSIFNCGGINNLERITILPVVSTKEILRYKDQIIESAESFISRCVSLEYQKSQGELPTEWDEEEDDDRCCYTNVNTGEVVHAPTNGIGDPAHIDPYFFTIYLKSVNYFPEVSCLINDSFHDAARILEVIFNERS